MRSLILAFFASLVALLGFAGTADAQTRPANCPPISIVQQANGTVFLQANSNGVLPNNAINAIAFTSDPHLVGSQTNVAIDLPGQPPGQHPPLNVALNPAQPTYTFTLRPLVPGQAVTLPVTIADSCSAWPTFVGAGPGVIPTALPTQTPTPMPSATRTPTIVPTPTHHPALRDLHARHGLRRQAVRQRRQRAARAEDGAGGAPDRRRAHWSRPSLGAHQCRR
jgi:hypothetical protein